MEGVEVNIYGPLSLIANAHNERHMYAFYAVKSDLLKKNSEANRGVAPLESATAQACHAVSFCTIAFN